jgi:hypothetical protein
MECKMLNYIDYWISVKNAGLTTINKTNGKYPDAAWKRKILLSEHSIIRKIKISAKWEGIKYWVSQHICRHKIGIEHFVRSQRPDRPNNTNNRDEQPQGALIQHEIEVNAQAIINISRKRLCNCAMPETREAWKAFLLTIKEKEPELYSVCVPDCIYRGYCYELNSCGYFKTNQFANELVKYRTGINNHFQTRRG